jgi:hypothetical protein
MPNPNQLYEDMEKLNALYDELCWGHDDELVFTHDVFFIIAFMPALMNTKGAVVGYKVHRDYGDTSIYSNLK